MTFPTSGLPAHEQHAVDTALLILPKVIQRRRHGWQLLKVRQWVRQAAMCATNQHNPNRVETPPSFASEHTFPLPRAAAASLRLHFSQLPSILVHGTTYGSPATHKKAGTLW